MLIYTKIWEGEMFLAVMKAIGRRSWIWSATAATALAAALTGPQLRHVQIVIQSPQGTRDLKVWTFRSTVQRILAQAGVAVAAHDRLSQKLTDVVGVRPIVVREAIPVWIRMAHRHVREWTTHYHVSNILRAVHVKIGPLDRVSPSLHSVLTANATITIVRRWWVKRDVSVTLPFRVQHQPNPNMWQGHQRVVAVGHDGRAVKTLDVLMQNGHAIRQKNLRQRVVQAPRSEVIQYGTRQLVSRGGQVLQFSRELSVVTTGYWPDPSWSSGYTTLGMKAHYGIVAVDPRVIPLGTRLYIPGYGVAIAGDTGSAIVGDRVDLCFNSQTAAQDWGVRPLQVFILK